MKKMKLPWKLGLALAAVATGVTAQAQFTLFATESQSGSLGGNTALYGGIQQYGFATTGGAATSGAGLAASALHDPVGLRAIGDTLYVGNRWGNQTGQGSVQQFTFDGTTLNFNQDITGNGLQRTHGLDLNPVTGELYAVNAFSSGMSRFTQVANVFTPNGVINGGDWRDVLASADGTKLYVTELNSTLRIFDLVNNTNTTFTVNGADAMHQMAWRNGSIYVTGFNSGTVHRIDLDANGNATSSALVANSSGAIGIAFSPDGQEMFVSGHTSNVINRFQIVNDVWTQTGSINTGHNMGYLAVVPEPGSLALLGLGALAVLKRRRK